MDLDIVALYTLMNFQVWSVVCYNVVERCWWLVSEQTKCGPVWEVYSAVLWRFLLSMLVKFHTRRFVVSCACRPPSCHCHPDVVFVPESIRS